MIKADITSFTNQFLQAYSSRTVEENWSLIKNAISEATHKHIPTKTSSNKKKHPWITHALRKKTIKRHRLYKKAKRSNDPKRKSAYIAFKKAVDKEIRHTKNSYINEFVVGGLHTGDSKPFFKYIKSLKQESLGLAPLKSGTNLETNAKEKADILINEFSGVFTNEDLNSVPWLGPAKSRIGDLSISSNGVEKLLAEIKPHKASGPDRIPNRVLKETASELAPALATLFNQSLQKGELPNDWLNAFISPVFKKGNVHVAANYRPVSLTSVACKLMEHIICSHIHAHLKENKLLTDAQHGFRKNHSCESQLLLTLDDFYTSFDSSNQTDVGILDFSRAFDTVPHQRLLGKLAHYGVQGPINKWIESFLTGRSMQVVVDGESSKPATVTSGVPQGTVLGPLLFLLYINDMPDVLTEGTSVRLFADDSLIYREIKNT